jgi:hypothetical protein
MVCCEVFVCICLLYWQMNIYLVMRLSTLFSHCYLDTMSIMDIGSTTLVLCIFLLQAV